MRQKGKAHEALSLLFSRDGVPDTLIMDGSKEQTLGPFRKKCNQAGCRVKQVEVGSQWSNSAESTIREIKRGAARKAVKAKSPKRFWDDCLELEADIRSHTALDIYELMGMTPETFMTGMPSDISALSELK